jgi:GT2 family glycosyltransferase
MTPVLSLVTGTRNRPESFKRLLDSIIEHTQTPWELIVGDASDVPYEAELPANVVLVPERPRLGYVKGYNALFRIAKGEWVIWLNDDAEVTAGYDVEAIRFMESHPKVGLGCLQFRDPRWPDFAVQSFLDIPYANFGIVRRQTGQDAGWFDEHLHMYGSDNAITFEMLMMGKGVAEIPNAHIIHHRVNDAVRWENQRGREADSDYVTAKYLHHKQRLQWTYLACLL